MSQKTKGKKDTKLAFYFPNIALLVRDVGVCACTAKLRYIELRYFEIPVLSNNGK